ncbi:MAG: hypothetical protein M3P40_05940 [Actinomycetota bacterium]|nr:hypothetical protein [Actinomycetota bacterium]
MSQPPALELDQFKIVAAEMREVFEERGYRVDVALEADPGFGSGASRASLVRDLAIDAASVAASRHGLDFRTVNGSGREFRCLSGGVDRRYRLRKAGRRSDGSYVIPTNAKSAMHGDDETLIPEELWVFGYTLTSEGTLQDVFLAPVLGIEQGLPGHLILGRVIELIDAPTTPAGFQPTDEDLEGFELDEGESGEFGS